MRPPKGLDWIEFIMAIVLIGLVIAFGVYMGNKYPACGSKGNICSQN